MKRGTALGQNGQCCHLDQGMCWNYLANTLEFKTRQDLGTLDKSERTIFHPRLKT